MADKVVVGAVYLGTCAPISASSGEQIRILYDEGSSTDAVGVGDRFVAVGGELLAGFDLREEGVNWRRHQGLLMLVMLAVSWSSSISP